MKTLEEFINAIGDTPEIRKEAAEITDLESLVTFVNAHSDKLSPEIAAEFDEIDYDPTREMSVDELMDVAGGAGEEFTGNEGMIVDDIEQPDPYVGKPAPLPRRRVCTTTIVNGVSRTTCYWTTRPE